MNRIYFVRHGEGQDNVARKFSSTWMDHLLTVRGKLQALQTGQTLTGRHIDGIFCSPMKRAHETAQIIAGQRGMDLTVMDEFRELNVGDLEGKDFTDENWAIYHNVTNQWYAGNPRACFPNGEDYIKVWERTRRAYLKILQNHDNNHFVIVGHGGIFAATLKEFVSFCKAVYPFQIPADRSKITLAKMLLVNLFSSLPFVAQKYDAPLMRQRVREIIQKEHIDLVHVDLLPLTAYINEFENLPKILVNHNVESVRLYRWYRTEPNPVKPRLTLVFNG